MNSNMKDNRLVGQLKELQTERAGGSPDARWLASTRETLMIQIGNTVGAQERKAGFRALAENLRIFLPQNLFQAMAVPLAIVLLVLGAGAGSSALVAAARDTLPGDAFYGVKLAAEAVSLKLAGKSERTERRIEIAGRRLDEMARLSSSADPNKEEKLAQVAALFSDEMTAVREGLDAIQAEDDAEGAVQVAMRIEAKTDEYQALFKHSLFTGRPTLRMALLSLDQVSVKALEILVEKQSLASNVLPEAQLSSAVNKRIDSFSAHVAVAENRLGADTPADSPSLLLTTKARAAVEAAKELLSQGDFQAAVRKVSEGAELVTEAETADVNPAPAESATSSPETASATDSEPVTSP